jgi:hypothetical protein
MIYNVVMIDRYTDGEIEVNFKSYRDLDQARAYYDHLIATHNARVIEGDEYYTVFDEDDEGNFLVLEIMESRLN